jgi:hypothetical protein
MQRREFIAGLAGGGMWPLAARSQHAAMPRVGVLLHLAEDDPEGKARLTSRDGDRDLRQMSG